MKYIYKNQSLNHTLCDELCKLASSEKTQLRHDNSESIQNRSKKLYNHLYYEINFQINSYIEFLNNQSNHIPYKYFSHNKFYISNFTIYKFDKTPINELFNDIQIDYNLYTYSVFRFIWVLNDVDNELVFFNNEKMKTSIGEIYIFPCYWSFPFTDTNRIDTKYFIIGYIEIEHEEIIHLDKYTLDSLVETNTT
jgi:hypothetical protein